VFLGGCGGMRDLGLEVVRDLPTGKKASPPLESGWAIKKLRKSGIRG